MIDALVSIVNTLLSAPIALSGDLGAAVVSMSLPLMIILTLGMVAITATLFFPSITGVPVVLSTESTDPEGASDLGAR